MNRYLLIESRDSLTYADVDRFCALAGDLLRQGHAVTLFLVQNAVLPARQSPSSQHLIKLIQDGVRVLADDFSLRERGISVERLVPGIESAQLDFVIEALIDGVQTIWH